jgi:hypothetical protein
MLNCLPKTLPRGLCAQWVRCGKPSCHCQHGRGHGPYVYRFWREKGRLRKAYVPPEQVAAFAAQVQERRERQNQVEQSRSHWRALVHRLREAEEALP